MLCQFAHLFPNAVETFLERGRGLKRRFREETVTDMMMGSLISVGGGRIAVDFPNEPVTGADMEWYFFNPDDGSLFRILLQAKRAYGEGNYWTRHSYKELFHTVGKSKRLQVSILCDAARHSIIPTYPLYIFYNPRFTCDLARKSGYRKVTGVCLADGYMIEALVNKSMLSHFPAAGRSLRAVSSFFFPLSSMFCPSTILEPSIMALSTSMPLMPLIPPTPQVLQNRLAQQRSLYAERFGDKFVENLPSVPAPTQNIPDELQDILDPARRQEASRKCDKWRVVFKSASPRDGEWMQKQRDEMTKNQKPPTDKG